MPNVFILYCVTCTYFAGKTIFIIIDFSYNFIISDFYELCINWRITVNYFFARRGIFITFWYLV